MESFKNKIKEYAQQKGADLIGVAPVKRFSGTPEGFHPCDILGKAESVIVIGKYFPGGVLAGTSKSAVTRTYETLFMILDEIAYNVASYIEKTGAYALPVPADTPYLYWDEETQTGKGDLSHKHSAVLAGLGVLGKNSLLITPEYGNRVNLVSIITSAVLPGDPVLDNDLCLKKCDLCVKACPSGAIRDNGEIIQKLCREKHSLITEKGYNLFACWKCRSICPVLGKLEKKEG